jgi:transcriptional regulator with XRE-family HTH domain
VVNSFTSIYTFTVKSKLPERLKQLRAEKGVSQLTLANELNFAPSFFAAVELGKSSISTETLLILADYFGVTTDYLLGRE